MCENVLDELNRALPTMNVSRVERMYLGTYVAKGR